MVQSLEYETAQTVLFWDILWQENFVCMNCATYLALKCAPMPPWPTSFEKSKIHEPNLEKLQFKGSKIEGFLLVFKGKCWKSSKNASILLPLNWNSSWLGWWILDFLRLWVREALWYILKPSRFHSSCKQNFPVTKCPKTVLF